MAGGGSQPTTNDDELTRRCAPTVRSGAVSRRSAARACTLRNTSNVGTQRSGIKNATTWFDWLGAGAGAGAGGGMKKTQ